MSSSDTESEDEFTCIAQSISDFVQGADCKRTSLGEHDEDVDGQSGMARATRAMEQLRCMDLNAVSKVGCFLAEVDMLRRVCDRTSGFMMISRKRPLPSWDSSMISSKRISANRRAMQALLLSPSAQFVRAYMHWFCLNQPNSSPSPSTSVFPGIALRI
jgi:hypothetical protein